MLGQLVGGGQAGRPPAGDDGLRVDAGHARSFVALVHAKSLKGVGAGSAPGAGPVEPVSVVASRRGHPYPLAKDRFVTGATLDRRHRITTLAPPGSRKRTGGGIDSPNLGLAGRGEPRRPGY